MLRLRNLTVAALCRLHQVGKPPKLGPNGEKRHRPIMVFESKKGLMGAGITIHEDVTLTRLDLLRRATVAHRVRSSWTQDEGCCGLSRMIPVEWLLAWRNCLLLQFSCKENRIYLCIFFLIISTIGLDYAQDRNYFEDITNLLFYHSPILFFV